ALGRPGLAAPRFALGNNIGTNDLTDAETTTGQSARAERILEQAGFETPASELVLVQGESARTPAFRRAVGNVITAVRATGATKTVRSPYGTGNKDQISADGRSAL